MKCPLLAHKTYIQDDYPVQVYEECLKEECAWWNEHNNECSVISTGKVLNAISTYLHEIKEKMPHEEQFRR